MTGQEGTINLSQRLLKMAGRPRMPRRTVRLRLALLYGGLFFISGAALLGITYVLVRQAKSGDVTYARGANGEALVRLSGGPGGPTLTVRVPGGLPKGVLPGSEVPPSDLQPLIGSQVAVHVHVHATVSGVAQSAGGVSTGGSAAAGEGAGHGGGGASAAGGGAVAGSVANRLVRRLPEKTRRLVSFAVKQQEAELNQLLIESGIALAVMSIVSIALGWLIAGRVLSPLRTITARTRLISERNLHERLALSGPGDELKELSDTIDGLLARLEAAFEAQRRFVANASHELRTPLAMMRTSLDVALGKPGPVPVQTRVLDGKLREGLDQADRLLESFLALSRAQNGLLAEQSVVSLPELAAAAIEAQSAAIAAKEIVLERHLASAEVRGSLTLLSRLLGNLLDNAVRHNEPAGWVSVATASGQSTATITVQSGGPVLRQGRVKELAQPFRRLAAERTGSETGVGLGLSIVAAIASAHQGELRLSARPEGGLRVEVELPSASRPQSERGEERAVLVGVEDGTAGEGEAR